MRMVTHALFGARTKSILRQLLRVYDGHCNISNIFYTLNALILKEIIGHRMFLRNVKLQLYIETLMKNIASCSM